MKWLRGSLFLMALLLAACQAGKPPEPVEASLQTQPAPKLNGQSDIQVSILNLDEQTLAQTEVDIVIEKEDTEEEELIKMVRNPETGKFGTRKTWTAEGPHRIYIHVYTPSDHLIFVEKVNVSP